MIGTSAALGDLYDGYYDAEVGRKRTITAIQTVDHLESMVRSIPTASFLDIGAGDGAVLAELHRRQLAELYHAVEISNSGLQAILSRKLPHLQWARSFDGYRIDARDGEFDLGLTAHVVEHVEHERAFLREASRVVKTLYVEVPLELTISVRRAIACGKEFGHINFYTPDTFRNLLVTSGLEVLDFAIFSNSLLYEQFVSGRSLGMAKHVFRSGLLRAFPAVAPQWMTYLAGALVRRAS